MTLILNGRGSVAGSLGIFFFQYVEADDTTGLELVVTHNNYLLLVHGAAILVSLNNLSLGLRLRFMNVL